MTLFALLPSPLLGPAVWEPVAARLREAGEDVLIADLGDGTPADAQHVLARFVEILPSDTPVVLVPHSNAGLYAPALIGRRPVSAVVFVDAALPPFDATEARTTSPRLYEFLAAKADEAGVLPVWTDWWDEADVAGLFPDGAIRQRVRAEQKRLPLAYFRDTVPIAHGWDSRPCAYLAFSAAYDEQAAVARERGWPVRVRSGGHLEMIVQPAAVAEDVLALLQDGEAISAR